MGPPTPPAHVSRTITSWNLERLKFVFISNPCQGLSYSPLSLIGFYQSQAFCAAIRTACRTFDRDNAWLAHWLYQRIDDRQSESSGSRLSPVILKPTGIRIVPCVLYGQNALIIHWLLSIATQVLFGSAFVIKCISVPG